MMLCIKDLSSILYNIDMSERKNRFYLIISYIDRNKCSRHFRKISEINLQSIDTKHKLIKMMYTYQRNQYSECDQYDKYYQERKSSYYEKNGLIESVMVNKISLLDPIDIHIDIKNNDSISIDIIISHQVINMYKGILENKMFIHPTYNILPKNVDLSGQKTIRISPSIISYHDVKHKYYIDMYMRSLLNPRKVKREYGKCGRYDVEMMRLVCILDRSRYVNNEKGKIEFDCEIMHRYILSYFDDVYIHIDNYEKIWKDSMRGEVYDMKYVYRHIDSILFNDDVLVEGFKLLGHKYNKIPESTADNLHFTMYSEFMSTVRSAFKEKWPIQLYMSKMKTCTTKQYRKGIRSYIESFILKKAYIINMIHNFIGIKRCGVVLQHHDGLFKHLSSNSMDELFHRGFRISFNYQDVFTNLIDAEPTMIKLYYKAVGYVHGYLDRNTIDKLNTLQIKPEEIVDRIKKIVPGVTKSDYQSWTIYCSDDIIHIFCSHYIDNVSLLSSVDPKSLELLSPFKLINNTGAIDDCFCPIKHQSRGKREVILYHCQLLKNNRFEVYRYDRVSHTYIIHISLDKSIKILKVIRLRRCRMKGSDENDYDLIFRSDYINGRLLLMVLCRLKRKIDVISLNFG